jgi:hypothetical protein
VGFVPVKNIDRETDGWVRTSRLVRFGISSIGESEVSFFEQGGCFPLLGKVNVSLFIVLLYRNVIILNYAYCGNLYPAFLMRRDNQHMKE